MIFRVKLLIYQGVEVTTAWENGTDAKMDGCICATSRLFDQHTQWCRMLTQIMGYIYILYGYTGQSGLWVGNQCPHSILNIAHQQGIWYPTKTASGKLSKNAKVGSKMGMGRDGKSQNWRDGMLMFTKVIKAPTPGLSVEESDHFRPLVARHLKYPSVKGQWRLYKHE